MASKLIGRTTCPECGFAAAHVKESEKCLYRYCPECGSQYNTRGERQRDLLTKKTRLVDAPAPSGSATAGSAAPADTATPTPKPTTGKPAATPAAPAATPTPTAPKRSGLFGFTVSE